MNIKTISLVLVIIATVNVSFAAIFLRLSESPAIMIGFYRLIFSVFILLPFSFKKTNFRELISMIKSQYKKLIIIGIAFGLHFVFWNMSLDLTTIGNSVFLVNTSPIFVAIVSYFYLKEKLRKIQWLGIFLSIAGSLLITFRDIISSLMWLGNTLALISALFLAIYLIGGRKIRYDYDLIPYVLVIYIIGAITLLFPVFIIEQSIIPISGLDWVYIIVLAFISTIFGHTLYNYSLKSVSASKISVVLLLEPVLSTIWAIFVFNEIPSYELIIGAIIILVGILLVLRYKVRTRGEK